MVSRALVLAGGGVTGIAWEIGVLAALAERGLDLVGTADLVVGTSAGSTVAAQVATGVRYDDLVAAQRAAAPTELAAPDYDVVERRAFLAAIVAGAADEVEACGRIGRMALEAETVPAPVRREVIAARLPVHEWPASRLVLAAVDADTGELVAFDRASGVSLVDAVAASCAVPGVWPVVHAGGRRLIDGGARSSINADLALGCDVVLVLAPYPLVGRPAAAAERELGALRAAGATVELVGGDEASRVALGPNPLDPARRAQSVEAGLSQGATLVDRVTALWSVA